MCTSALRGDSGVAVAQGAQVDVAAESQQSEYEEHSGDRVRPISCSRAGPPTCKTKRKAENVLLVQCAPKRRVGISIQAGGQAVGMPSIEAHSGSQSDRAKNSEEACKCLHEKRVAKS